MLKKVVYILILIPLLFIISGCGNKTYDEITYKELNNMLADKESFVLFIGSTTCTHCDAYKVTLNKVIEEYNVDVKYIDIYKISENKVSSLQAKFPFTGTPTTVFIKNGEEESTFNRIEGEASYSEVVDAFKENGYIKE